jgi:hypothetical protein
VNRRKALKLTADDLSRHKRMVARVTEAQQLQVEIDRLAGRRDELLAAFKVHCEDLHERYGLATDGSENIAPDGTITRSALPAAERDLRGGS